MSEQMIRIGDRVLVDELALKEHIAGRPTHALHLRATVHQYEVIGEGPTCYGLKIPGSDKGFNIPKNKVMKV